MVFDLSDANEFEQEHMIKDYDTEDEQTVIGAMLSAPDAADVVLNTLKPEDLYCEEHQTILQVALDVQERGEPVNIASVGTLLKESDVFDTIGGAFYLKQLMETPPSYNPLEVQVWCRHIKDLAHKRQAKNIIRQSWSALSDSRPVDQVLGTIQSNFEQLRVDLPGNGNQLRAYSGADLISLPPPKWIIRRLAPKSAVGVLSARPGAGKSWLAMAMAQAVSKGGKFLETFPINGGPVIYFDQENFENEMARRVRQLNMTDDDVQFVFDPLKLTNDNNFARIVSIVRKSKPSLVIFDSLIRFHEGLDENSATDMRQVMERLQRIAELGPAVWVLHHHRKMGVVNPTGEMARGSTDIIAAAHIHLALEQKRSNPRSDGEQTEMEMTLSQPKNRCGLPIRPLKIRLVDTPDGHTVLEALGEVEPEASKVDTAKDEIVKLLSAVGKMTRPRIIEALKGIGGERTIDTGLKELIADNVLRDLSGRPKEYDLADSDDALPF